MVFENRTSVSKINQLVSTITLRFQEINNSVSKRYSRFRFRVYVVEREATKMQSNMVAYISTSTIVFPLYRSYDSSVHIERVKQKYPLKSNLARFRYSPSFVYWFLFTMEFENACFDSHLKLWIYVCVLIFFLIVVW